MTQQEQELQASAELYTIHPILNLEVSLNSGGIEYWGPSQENKNNALISFLDDFRNHLETFRHQSQGASMWDSLNFKISLLDVRIK